MMFAGFLLLVVGFTASHIKTVPSGFQCGGCIAPYRVEAGRSQTAILGPNLQGNPAWRDANAPSQPGGLVHGISVKPAIARFWRSQRTQAVRAMQGFRECRAIRGHSSDICRVWRQRWNLLSWIPALHRRPRHSPDRYDAGRTPHRWAK